ncbi:transglutaminase-like cysteine peptidase [Ideonella margarita]|uniref:Transglutaminase-like cysteine peptidase n=1 Tax=Ideonella margarita TaxID=2984191 RepID=A0ABU9C894_9BURK
MVRCVEGGSGLERLAGPALVRATRAWAFVFLVLVSAAACLSWAAPWDANRILTAASRHGDAAVAGVRALQANLAKVPPRDDASLLATVNSFFNQRIAFREDLENWGQVDYWASPLESLQRGAGDCEDYAIAKYFTLISTGVPHKRLRLVYVRAAVNGLVVPHMVLAFYPSADADPLVLDNLVPDIRPASRRPDLTPVFSFNAEAIWEGVGTANVGGSPGERLSRWRDVLIRGKQEGFL